MSWLEKLLPSKIQQSDPTVRRQMPEGLWIKCPSCETVLYKADLEQNQNVCPKCSHHHRIGAKGERFRAVAAANERHATSMRASLSAAASASPRKRTPLSMGVGTCAVAASRTARWRVWRVCRARDAPAKPMAKSSADCALLLEVIAGYDDGRDPRQFAGLAPKPYVAALAQGVKGMRFGLVREASLAFHRRRNSGLRRAFALVRLALGGPRPLAPLALSGRGVRLFEGAASLGDTSVGRCDRRGFTLRRLDAFGGTAPRLLGEERLRAASQLREVTE